jgi:hypothetical protein
MIRVVVPITGLRASYALIVLRLSSPVSYIARVIFHATSERSQSMSDTDKKPDQEKGDEILKRMLKTPPGPES